MDSILASCSRIEYDEKLVFQCLISPLDESRQSKVRKQIDLIKDGKSLSTRSKLWSAIMSFKSDEDNKDKKPSHHRSSTQLSDLEKKGEDELFQVNIRVFATSPQPTRPKLIVQDVTRTLNQYNYSGFNSLTTKERTDVPFLLAVIERKFVSHSMMYNFFRTRRTILNIKELSSIIHFPHFKFNKNPRIKRQNYKIVPAPDTIPQEGMLL